MYEDSTWASFVGIIVGFAFAGLIGLLVGRYKKRPRTGFWLGLLLGPIGWIITLLLADEKSDQAKYRGDHSLISERMLESWLK